MSMSLSISKEFFMRILVFVFCVFFTSVVLAEDRVGMVIPSNEENEVQNLMEKLQNSINNEDYKAYVSCFTKELSSKNKKKMAALFLQHDMEMELEKFSITDTTKDTIEFTARYSVDIGGNINTIISSIVAKKIDNNLVISDEEIVSKVAANRRATPQNDFEFGPFGQNPNANCPDGNCPLVNNNILPNFNNEEEKEDRQVWVPMFNNAQGKPDENGPMWVDPMVMVRMFPEKYPPSCGGKCEKVNPQFR